MSAWGKILLLSLLVATSTAGLSLASATAEYIPVPPDPASLQPADVAVVEGSHILQARYDQVFRIYLQQLHGPPTASEQRNAIKQIMKSLIEADWYQLEGVQLGVVITDQQVRDRFEPLKRQTFPNERAYKRFLTETGQTEQDLLDLVRGQLTREAIRSIWVGTVTVPAAEIAAEYRKHRSRYSSRRNPRTLAQATPTIRRALRRKKKRIAIAVGLKSFEARWKGATLCRSTYLVAQCGLSAG